MSEEYCYRSEPQRFHSMITKEGNPHKLKVRKRQCSGGSDSLSGDDEEHVGGATSFINVVMCRLV